MIQPLFPHGANEINGGYTVTFNEMLFQLIFLGIGTAAIGEEMLMRGFLLNNLNGILGTNFMGTAGAVLIQAFLFAILHSGVQGMVSAGVIGLILGVFYILSGRNLLVVMAATRGSRYPIYYFYLSKSINRKQLKKGRKTVGIYILKVSIFQLN